MHKEMISVGLGILAAAIPLLVPNLSPLFGYGLFAVAAILVLLGAWGFMRTTATVIRKGQRHHHPQRHDQEMTPAPNTAAPRRPPASAGQTGCALGAFHPCATGLMACSITFKSRWKI